MRRPPNSSTTRRGFLKGAVAVAAPYIIPASAFGANERVAVGCIGVGPRGTSVMKGFLDDGRTRVVAVCDVNKLRREDVAKRLNQHYGDKGCKPYNDFRELLNRPDIDVVSIASTDHWHVLHALYAARAGKDMYVEKPLGLNVVEGRALRDAVQRYDRVFQFGTQQRSSWNFRFACELVRNGRIGRLHTMRVGAPPSHAAGNYPAMPVPDWLDYDMWLGPAPWAPYTENRIVNNFWWHISDYAVGFVAGWGIHHVDIAQWGNGTDRSGPIEVEGAGSYPRDGMCDCATSWNVELTYANGVKMDYKDNNHNAQGVRFEGSDGWVYVKRGYIEAEPKSLLKTVIGPGEVHLYKSKNHVGNFVDCVINRKKTVCPIEVAVRSDTICYLSDIAMRLRKKLRWDPACERFVDDPEADRMLSRAMRGPWRL